MPLRAITPCGKSYSSYSVDDSEWATLRNRTKRPTLLMPCCDSKAIPKQNKYGTRYFSHQKKSGCLYKSETKEHLNAKLAVARVASEAGWEVFTEYKGETPNGKVWFADVMCIRGNAKIAIEIQWSWQSMADYRIRQEIYRESGVRCAWFFRLRKSNSWDDDLSTSRDIPMFGMIDVGENFVFPSLGKSKIEEVTSDLLNGNIRYWPEYKKKVELNFYTADFECPSCKSLSKNIARIEIIGGKNFKLKVDEGDNIFKNILNRFIVEIDESNELGRLGRHYLRLFPYSTINRKKTMIDMNSCSHCRSALESNPYWYRIPELNNKPHAVIYSNATIDMQNEGSWYHKTNLVDFIYVRPDQYQTKRLTIQSERFLNKLVSEEIGDTNHLDSSIEFLWSKWTKNDDSCTKVALRKDFDRAVVEFHRNRSNSGEG